MSKLPSFEQFNESLKADINEGVFHRLPKNIISDELYLTSKNLQNFYDRTAAGNDVDPGVIDTIIRGLDKVKKAVKRFNSKEEVTGTVYEGEVLLYDEIGTELESLKKKIKDLMRITTNNKWVSALGSALTALSNLDRNLSQHDAKLGSIVTESEMNEGSSDLTMREKQLHGELSQVVFSYKNLKKAEKVNAVKALIPRLESGELSESEMNEGDMTKFYDGFIVLDFKNKNMYKFKYIKGSSNVNVEKIAIDKLVKSTGESQANFTVHGFVKKGEWNTDKTPVLESEEVNEASVQVAGNAKPSGAQVLATVIIEHLMKNEYLKPGADKVKKELISDIQKVIMDSTF
jgi:hypothetical protein